MPTDRAFACLLIAALLLCSAARQVVSTIKQEAEVSAPITRQGSVGTTVGGSLAASRGRAV